jgi:tripartite-type tricarboxylate transporter receptor subunit TctC
VSEGQLLRRFNYSIWTGYFVKSGTPEHVARKLNAALAKVLADPRVKGQLQVQNVFAGRAEPLPELAKFYSLETAMYRTMFSATKISVQ